MSPPPEHGTNVTEISGFLEHVLSSPKVPKPSPVRTWVEISDHLTEPYYCRTSASARVTVKTVTAHSAWVTGPGAKGSTCLLTIGLHGDPRGEHGKDG